MKFIRQGATHKVVLGPAVAVANGYVPVTSLALSTADEAEAILHDNGTVVDISGYTWAAITTADGYYHLTLQSGISGTVGHLTIVVQDDSLCLPLREDFTVIEEAAYDALFAASAPGFATVAALATAQTDLDTLTGSDGATLATSQPNYAPATAAALATAQTDLDTITGSDGVTLATTQGNYAPATAANLATVAGYLDTEIAAILEDTGTTLPALIADVPTVAEFEARTIAAANYATAANLATVDTVVDNLNLGIIYGAAETGTLSTTQATTDLTGYADDQLIGRHITVLTGDAAGEQREITDYANTGGLLTFAAMTVAMADSDTFKIT